MPVHGDQSGGTISKVRAVSVWQDVPVGFHVMSPLNRPISSSSVHGSVSSLSSLLLGEAASAGAGVGGCEVGVGEVAWDMRALFRGGMVHYSYDRMRLFLRR